MSSSSPRPLRVVFAGTPEFAARHLDWLLNYSAHDVVAVYSQPDRPAGRGKKLTPGPVKQLALQNDIPVFQPVSLKTPEQQQQLAALQADVMVVVAYGLLLPKPILETPTFGCINVHASLLPRWRGAAPIQRAIEAGDSETGITIMQMDEGLDTGDMLNKTACEIDADETAASLYDKLIALGGPALGSVLDDIAVNRLAPEQQDDRLSCYARKIDKAEAQIDWSLPAAAIDRKIRAFNPAPVCFSLLDSDSSEGGERVKIWRASAISSPASATSSGEPHTPGTIINANKQGILVQTGDGALLITQLLLPGKKPMSATDVLNSRADMFAPGKRFQPPQPSR